MLLLKILPVFLIFNLSFAASITDLPVNKQCPLSGRNIDPAQSLSYGVCCGNCLKKATANVSKFIKKAKPNNKTCPLSAKPVRKKLTIGFCCSKCKKKASS